MSHFSVCSYVSVLVFLYVEFMLSVAVELSGHQTENDPTVHLNKRVYAHCKQTLLISAPEPE